MEITARTDGGMRVEVQARGLTTVIDEPADKGGTDTAPTPMETLLGALAGCTAITLKLYSARKQWPLEDVEIRVRLALPEKGASDPTRHITQEVVLKGPLDDEQRERLQQIAGRCPVHRVLEGPNAFTEQVVEALGAGS
jgi:putative redox protein